MAINDSQSYMGIVRQSESPPQNSQSYMMVVIEPRNFPQLGFSDRLMIAVQNYRFPAGPLMSAALRNPNNRSN